MAVPERAVLHSPILSKGSVVNLVIERIKEALIYKELKPGDYLPSEDELARNFGVGKSTIREAIKMLQALGVVEVKRGQGTVISSQIKEETISPLVFQLILSGGRIDDVLDLRMIIEPAYTLEAMHRATEEDLASIEQTVAHFEEVIALGTQQAEDDIAFHLAILKATHNPFIEMIGKTIFQLFKASIERSMSEIPKTAIDDHKAILRAFKAKDAAALDRAVKQSFIGWEQSLHQEIEL